MHLFSSYFHFRALLYKSGKYTLAYNVEKAQLKMDKAQEAYEVALSIYNKALADVKTILETLTK